MRILAKERVKHTRTMPLPHMNYAEVFFMDKKKNTHKVKYIVKAKYTGQKTLKELIKEYISQQLKNH